ncbi:tetratricopeptide repeat protein [Phaeodactylibacter xiamenensis]|uniref:tetratricopeptide repeat protein n=1 Tax=Phaeodactylibacter xiamenensis TaxID=1524460 RepID=UPI003CCBBE64
MSNTISHNITLNISSKQQEALTNHYDHLLLKLENGRPLTPQLLDNLRQAMREVLEAQPELPQILEAARTQHQLVQLTHEDNTLLNLPWRLAVEEVPFLYLTKRLPASRQNEQALQNPLPLKVLVMISAPEDTHTRLSYEEEEDRIIQAFGPLYEQGQVQLDFTEDGSLQSLKQKLKENHYHILHFSGHGTFRDGQGWLELEDGLHMEKQLISASEFAATLNAKPEHCPALVLLSSCQTAQGQKEETFKGVSNRLLEIGVPAVVAMGLSISDYFATVFANHLYQQLAEKEPLHRAFQSAVRHTQQEETRLLPKQPPAQWMIPQLYTNGAVSDLVDWKAAYTPLAFQNYKFITGQHALLLERHEGYQFLGRRRERRQALPLLIDKQPVLLRGQGGVGKTAMAEHLVQRLALQDGSIYPFVFNENTARLEDVIKAMKDYLRTEHDEFLIDNEVEEASDEAMKQFLYLLKRVKKVCTPCFVFDNLETFQSEPGGSFATEYSDTKEVIDFLYQNRLCPLLLTGRYPLADFPEVEEIDLNQVRFADFLKKCQQLGLDKLLREKATTALKKAAPGTFQELAQQLHQSFGGNYRALEFFDKLYRQHQGQAENTLATLYDYLEQYKGEVLHEMSENLVFNHLVGLLTEEERRCLGIMYHFRRPVLPLAVAMQEAGVGDEEEALKRLVQLTLLEKLTEYFDTGDKITYYYLTPLVKNMITQVKMPRPYFLEERAGRYYYYACDSINKSISDLEESWYHYYSAENKEWVGELGNALCAYFYDEFQFGLSQHYGLGTKHMLSEETNGIIHNTLGKILDTYGEYDNALREYDKASKKFRQEKNPGGEGETLNNISQVYTSRGEYQLAVKYLEKSLKISRELQDHLGIATCLNNLGNTYKEIGNYKKAMKYLTSSLEVLQQTEGTRMKGTIINNISQVHQLLGEYNQALDLLHQSLKLRQAAEDPAGMGVTLNNIGIIHICCSRYDKALHYLLQSLEIHRELGNRRSKVVALNNLGVIAQGRSEHKKALEFFKESLKISQTIGDRQNEGNALNNISQTYKAYGDYSEALGHLEQGLKIYQSIGNQSGEACCLNNIGAIYIALEKYDMALDILIQSLKICQHIGDLKGQGKACNNLSQVYKCKGRYRKAIKYLKRALKIQQKLGDIKTEATILNNLGTTAGRIGIKRRALKYLKHSLFLSQQIKDTDGVATSLHNLGSLYYDKKDWSSAVACFNRSYNLWKKIGSPMAEKSSKFLDLLCKQLGQARVQEILQQQNQ